MQIKLKNLKQHKKLKRNLPVYNWNQNEIETLRDTIHQTAQD